jgi:hypothetical protein
MKRTLLTLLMVILAGAVISSAQVVADVPTVECAASTVTAAASIFTVSEPDLDQDWRQCSGLLTCYQKCDSNYQWCTSTGSQCTPEVPVYNDVCCPSERTQCRTDCENLHCVTVY